MVHIELTDHEAKLLADWLQDSFNLLEVGGSHRIEAVKVLTYINLLLGR